VYYDEIEQGKWEDEEFELEWAKDHLLKEHYDELHSWYFGVWKKREEVLETYLVPHMNDLGSDVKI